MKKLLLTSVLSLSALMAASNEEILSLYSGLSAQGLNVKVNERIPLKDASGFDMVILEISSGDMKQNEILFTNGDLIMPEVFNVKTKDDYKTKFENEILFKNFSAVYNKEDKANIIKIGDDKNKETLIILTDTDCPYCRQEMEMIDERLKEYNLELIMASIHDDKAHAKSYKIYEEIKGAKTDADKVKILKKYYDPALTSVDGVSAENIGKMKDIASKYFSSGVRGVPFIFNKKDLVK